MKILMVGDVFGRAGRKTFAEITPKLKAEKKIDVVVVNGENAAHGSGLTVSTFNFERRRGYCYNGQPRLEQEGYF